MRSFKPYKSPGPDGIYPALIQQGIDVLTPFLIDIYSESINKRRPAYTWLKKRHTSYQSQENQTTWILKHTDPSVSALLS